MRILIGYFTLASLISEILNQVQIVQNERRRLLHKELGMMLGSDIVINKNEQIANKTIMALKLAELENNCKHPNRFHFSKHFFEYKDKVKETALYRIIKKMPKGASLHVHSTALLRPDYVLAYTYWENLYICSGGDNLKFRFSLNTPSTPCSNEWLLLKEVRNSSKDTKTFDAGLRKHFTVVIDNPKEVYTDVNKVWNKFNNYFSSTSGLLRFKPVYEDYFYNSMKAFRKDNVMYIEMRAGLGGLYDLEGNIYDPLAAAEIHKNVLDRFVNDYPDFFGVKLIYAPAKTDVAKNVNKYVQMAKAMHNKLPNFLAGFDLVGQEDTSPPLTFFLPELVHAADKLNYFLHAGETNWNGFSDENIFDAIVLNTTRIGHGFALVKHPVLKKEVKKRGIAVEVNVISNAVLDLVQDIRNHPLATFLAEGVPVVLSSDDPGIWEADPMTHDYYVTFLGVASRRADLRLLKKLALNSLYYSTYHDKEKIVREFEKRWSKFIGNGKFTKEINKVKSGDCE